MRKSLFPAAFLLLSATIAHALIAAPSVGLVFDRQVFLQEYWRFGIAYVQVTNRTPQDAAVTVTAPDGTPTGPWKVKAGVSKSFRTPEPKKVGENWRVAKDGTSMGLFDSPQDKNLPKEEGFASCVNLNGWGRNPDLWMVQKASRYDSGSVIEVSFHIKSQSGVLTLSKTPSGLPANLSLAPVIDAASDTLTVREDENGISLDLSAPKKEADWHRVTARFRAPKTKALTVAIIDGTIGEAGRPRRLTRGVVIGPQKAGNPSD